MRTVSIYKPQKPSKNKEDDLRELIEYSRRRVVALQQDIRVAEKEKNEYFVSLRTLMIDEMRNGRKNEFLTHPNKIVRELAESLLKYAEDKRDITKSRDDS